METLSGTFDVQSGLGYTDSQGSVSTKRPPPSQAWQRSRPGSVPGVAAEGGLTEMEARRLAQGVAQRAARNPGSHSCRAAEGTPSPPVSGLPLKVLVHTIVGPALKSTLGDEI